MAYFLYMHYRDITFYVFKRKTKYMLAFLQYTNYYKFTKNRGQSIRTSSILTTIKGKE